MLLSFETVRNKEEVCIKEMSKVNAIKSCFHASLLTH